MPKCDECPYSGMIGKNKVCWWASDEDIIYITDDEMPCPLDEWREDEDNIFSETMRKMIKGGKDG